MRHAQRFALLIVLASALAACKQEQPAPAADTAAPAAEPAKIPGTDAIAAVDNTDSSQAAPPVAGLDAKAFAGSFVTQGITLTLAADGTYTLRTHAESAGADLETKGTWTAEGGGKQLLLDADDKAEADRRYDVVSKDELKATEGGQVLRREG